MISAGKSDIGLVRKVNEDSFLCLKLNDDSYLFMVADGMGGHNAGEVASSMAVNEVVAYIKEEYGAIAAEARKDEKSILDIVRDAVLAANDKIYKKSIRQTDCLGMGTTLSMALLLGNKLFIGHVGDSRIYLIRKKSIKKLTEDHSLVAELIKSGTIKPEEANNHPQKNIITRALGSEYNTEVDVSEIELNTGDYVLFCTDGLSNLITEDEMVNVVSNVRSMDEACDEFIKEAKDRGGHDNITVIIIKMDKDGDCSDR